MSDDRLDQALKELVASGPIERPNDWVAIINNESYSEMHRARCFGAFFQRFNWQRTPLLELLSIEGVQPWFLDAKISNVTVASRLPSEIDRSKRKSVFAIYTRIYEGSRCAVYVTFLDECSVSDIRRAVQGEGTECSLRIDQIAADCGTF